MKASDRVLRALRALEARRSRQEISVADVARLAKVSWPTANRHLGGKAGLDALLDRRPAPPPDTRDRLLTAAARCFGRDGYPATTLDGVALEAGLTKGAVYWYFQGKRDLLLAMLREHLPGRELDPPLVVELLALARDTEIRSALIDLQTASRIELGALAALVLRS